jgi:hypothetical protein
MKAIKRAGGIFMALSGAVFASVGISLYIRDLEPIRWTEVPATLLEAKAYKHIDVKGVASYLPQVRYRYEVDGKAYDGKQYSLIAWRTSVKEAVEGAIRQLQESQRNDSHIHARYNPERHEESVVAFGVSTPPFLAIAFSSPFVLFGVGIASMGIRKRILFLSLGLGSIIGMIAAILHFLFLAHGLFLSAWPVALWAGGIAAGLFLALKIPAFVHGKEMARLAQKSRVGPASRPRRRRMHSRHAARSARRQVLLIAILVFAVFVVGGFFAGNMDDDFNFFVFACSAGFGAFSSVFFTLILLFFHRLVASDTEKRREALEAFAEQVEGRLEWASGPTGERTDETPKGVAFSTDGVAGTVEVVEGSGKEDNSFTSVVFRHGRGAAFRCLVRPRGKPSTGGDGSVLAKVEMDWEVFRDLYIVLSDAESMAKRVLSREIQESIISISLIKEEAFAFRLIREVVLSIDGSTLEIKVQGLLMSLSAISLLHETGVRILRSLLREVGAMAP